MNFWRIVIKEFHAMLAGQRKTLFFLVAFPLLYMLLFGAVYMTSMVKYIPCVVYDQDQSGTSRKLVQAFEDSERYQIVASVNSEEEMHSYLMNKKAQAAIAIPPDFAKDIKRGRASEVLLVANGANVLFANPAITAAMEIVQTFNAGVGQKLVEAAGLLPDAALKQAAAVQIRVRVLSNPTYGYADFVLPGLVTASVQLGIMLAICSSLSREYRRLEEWQGVSSFKLVLAKLIPYWVLGLMAYLLCFVLLVTVFEVPMKGNLMDLVWNGAAFVLCIVGVGSVFSAAAPDETMAVQMPAIYIMPAFLYSGYSWPQIAMNQTGVFINALLPLTYVAENVRDIMLNGYAPHIYRDTGILLAAGTVLVIFTVAIFSWRRKRGGSYVLKLD